MFGNHLLQIAGFEHLFKDNANVHTQKAQKCRRGGCSPGRLFLEKDSLKECYIEHMPKESVYVCVSNPVPTRVGTQAGADAHVISLPTKLGKDTSIDWGHLIYAPVHTLRTPQVGALWTPLVKDGSHLDSPPLHHIILMQLFNSTLSL